MSASEAIEREQSSPRPRVVVVMPAYNAERTLKLTYDALPKNLIDSIILVDDGSSDNTINIARSLDLNIYLHRRNYGYGANQKTCYTEALRDNADITVMVHPDYQYDPTVLPELIAPITRGDADVVLGSRILHDRALEGGMPWWKYISNRALTAIENYIFGLRLSEYHTGYRAYRRQMLEELPFVLNSDGFIFDQEIIAQAVVGGFRIQEVPVPTRYFREASSLAFFGSVVYGVSILWLLARYVAFRLRLSGSRQFRIHARRYHPD